MDLLQTLCHRLGTSHAQLAGLINAKRSTVTKSAAGTRQLPYEPTIALVQLQTLIQQLPETAADAPTTDGEFLAIVVDRLQECRYKILLLQRKLKNMQLRYQQAVCLLQTVTALAETTDTNPRQQNLREELKYQAEKKLIGCSKSKQQLLEIEITLLQKAIELYEAAGRSNG